MPGLPTGRRWGVALWHTGPAIRPHIDLLIAAVPQCPTLQICQQRATWIAAHRRRYLQVQGPVSGGRGRIQRRWQGPLLLRRTQGGLDLAFAGICCRLTRDRRIVPWRRLPRMLRT